MQPWFHWLQNGNIIQWFRHIHVGLWHACTSKHHFTTKKEASTYWNTCIKVQGMPNMKKKMWSKSEHALNAIWALNGFFTDEWSEIRTPSTLQLPCLEHVDTSTSRSRCIINEAGLTWIPVREKNVCVRVVPYISTLCVNVVQSRPSRATIVILTSKVVWK